MFIEVKVRDHLITHLILFFNMITKKYKMFFFIFTPLFFKFGKFFKTEIMAIGYFF